MADATKHITASMRKVCEGCGETGRRTNRGLCAECSKKSRRIKLVHHGRVRRRMIDMPPLISDHRTISGVCAECGCQFTVRAAHGSRFQPTGTYCSRECQKRNADRTSTRIRRAKTKGAKAEPIDYNAVFKRDAWRCGICGRKTIRSERGTGSDRSPVIDHIVPLSAGGQHTYRNVQCACHSCNTAKSNGAGGQLRLFG